MVCFFSEKNLKSIVCYFLFHGVVFLGIFVIVCLFYFLSLIIFCHLTLASVC